MGNRKDISQKTQNLLWARAAGRCEFEGCNCNLTLDELTQDTENEGQIAHIVAASEKGPRGNAQSISLQDKIENLMLLCPKHHKLIDGDNREKYPEKLLLEMKKKHEERIKTATSIAPDKRSLVVIYTAPIGKMHLKIPFKEAKEAIFPFYYPSENSPIDLSQKSPFEDEEDNYWAFEYASLKKIYRDKLEDVEKGNVNHISLFALAPQPLLVYLGTLIGDIRHVTVYQKHREPDTWRWLDIASDNHFTITKPESTDGDPVLIFAISAEYITKRVRELYNHGESIWVISCDNPHNDMLQSPTQLSEFRSYVRKVLDEINTLTKSSSIKIHMAMPAACAVELGRVRMPKADKQWILYDYNSERNKDFETIII